MIKVMHFHQTHSATWNCACYVDAHDIGHDAIGGLWRVVTDDFGNIVFVRG